MRQDNYKAVGKWTEEKLKEQFTFRLAKHIRKVREAKGLTQEDLAYQAGLNGNYVGYLEAGRYSPTLFTLWRLCQAMDMSLKEFLTDFNKD